MTTMLASRRIFRDRVGAADGIAIVRKAVVGLLASIAWAGLASLTYCVHVRFFRVDVVLYGALFDAALAAFAMAALLFAWRGFAVFNAFEKSLLGVVWLLAGSLAALALPAVIDRSLSFYILEKLQQRGGGIQLARFEDVFTREYVKEHRLVDVRLTEQQVSGTVVIENGCVRLTPRGQRLAEFSRFFRAHLLPKERLLAGRYTDALVDPFRDGGEVPDSDYRCR